MVKINLISLYLHSFYTSEETPRDIFLMFEGSELTALSLWSSSTERMFTHHCVCVCVCVSSGLSRVMHSFHYPHQINVQHSSSMYCRCSTTVCVSPKCPVNKKKGYLIGKTGTTSLPDVVSGQTAADLLLFHNILNSFLFGFYRNKE